MFLFVQSQLHAVLNGFHLFPNYSCCLGSRGNNQMAITHVLLSDGLFLRRQKVALKPFSMLAVWPRGLPSPSLSCLKGLTSPTMQEKAPVLSVLSNTCFWANRKVRSRFSTVQEHTLEEGPFFCSIQSIQRQPEGEYHIHSAWYMTWLDLGSLESLMMLAAHLSVLYIQDLLF